ncbi:hypothetical protein LT330_000436 [Penicillium expansum]|nr:hypothetical protein LT330_000436 [Penicillium expansum]
MMYANWSRKIAPMAPWVYSCVWAEENEKQSRFHLGASLGGYRNPEGQGSRWVKILQRARFDVLRDERIDTAGITFESTTLMGRGGRPIPFGNCAETYPLVNILHEEVYGLAVMLTRLPEDTYDHQQALSTLTIPCANCQSVITTWGGNVDNFISDNTPNTALPILGRASGLNINLPTGAKRPSPADNIAEPAAKRAKGWKPEIPQKPSHLQKEKVNSNEDVNL